MYKMNEDEEQDWTFMSTNPPGEWGEARMERLLDLGHSTAARFGAGDQVDDVVEDVILDMIEKRAWWNDPKHPIGNPKVFKGFMTSSFKNKTNDYHRNAKRERERSISITARNASRGYEGAIRPRAESMHPRLNVDPEEVAIQNEERLRVRTELSRVLFEFVSTLDNKNKVTYEIFKEQARFSESSRGREEKTVEYLWHVVGLLSPPRSPREHGLERTGELIKAYMATDPSLKSGAVRKRITRLRRAFRPFKKRVEVVYDNLRS